MDINWLGHSCFRIKGNQVTIVTDPYPPDLGYTLPALKANIVTVSHKHPSHSYVQGVGGNPRIISGPGEYEIGGVVIIGVATYHDGEGGKVRGKNSVYLIELDGVVICHLGDLGHALTATQVEEISKVDVLMLPVGGVSTINAANAANIIRQLDPKAILPMHYKTPVIDRELEPVEKFLKEMGITQVTAQPKLSITKSNLPLSMQVFQLDYSA